MSLRLALLSFLILSARDEPLQVYDEGVKQGQALNVNCTGSGVTCTRSFDGGVNGTLWTLNVSGGVPDCPGQLIAVDGGILVCSATVAGGLNTQVQYNNNGFLGGVSNLTSSGTYVVVGNDAGTVANPADGVAFYAKRSASDWSEPNYTPPVGGASALMDNLVYHQGLMWMPGGSTTVTCSGLGCNAGVANTTGTVTTLAPTTGSDDLHLRYRTSVVSAAVGNSPANITENGMGSGIGAFESTWGYKFYTQFSSTRVPDSAMFFAGVRDAVATPLTTFQPSSILEAAYCGMDSDAGSLALCSSSPDGGKACTPCGSSFDIHDAGTFFECRIIVAPNAASIGMSLTKVSTGEVCQVHRTTAVPAAGYPMMALMATNNGKSTNATEIQTTGVICQAASN